MRNTSMESSTVPSSTTSGVAIGHRRAPTQSPPLQPPSRSSSASSPSASFMRAMRVQEHASFLGGVSELESPLSAATCQRTGSIFDMMSASEPDEPSQSSEWDDDTPATSSSNTNAAHFFNRASNGQRSTNVENQGHSNQKQGASHIVTHHRPAFDPIQQGRRDQPPLLPSKKANNHNVARSAEVYSAGNSRHSGIAAIDGSAEVTTAKTADMRQSQRSISARERLAGVDRSSLFSLSLKKSKKGKKGTASKILGVKSARDERGITSVDTVDAKVRDNSSHQQGSSDNDTPLAEKSKGAPGVALKKDMRVEVPIRNSVPGSRNGSDHGGKRVQGSTDALLSPNSIMQSISTMKIPGRLLSPLPDRVRSLVSQASNFSSLARDGTGISGNKGNTDSDVDHASDVDSDDLDRLMEIELEKDDTKDSGTNDVRADAPTIEQSARISNTLGVSSRPQIGGKTVAQPGFMPMTHMLVAQKTIPSPNSIVVVGDTANDDDDDDDDDDEDDDDDDDDDDYRDDGHNNYDKEKNITYRKGQEAGGGSGSGTVQQSIGGEGLSMIHRSPPPSVSQKKDECDDARRAHHPSRSISITGGTEKIDQTMSNRGEDQGHIQSSESDKDIVDRNNSSSPSLKSKNMKEVERKRRRDRRSRSIDGQYSSSSDGSNGGSSDMDGTARRSRRRSTSRSSRDGSAKKRRRRRAKESDDSDSGDDIRQREFRRRRRRSRSTSRSRSRSFSRERDGSRRRRDRSRDRGRNESSHIHTRRDSPSKSSQRHQPSSEIRQTQDSGQQLRHTRQENGFSGSGSGSSRPSMSAERLHSIARNTKRSADSLYGNQEFVKSMRKYVEAGTLFLESAEAHLAGCNQKVALQIFESTIGYFKQISGAVAPRAQDNILDGLCHLGRAAAALSVMRIQKRTGRELRAKIQRKLSQPSQYGSDGGGHGSQTTSASPAVSSTSTSSSSSASSSSMAISPGILGLGPRYNSTPSPTVPPHGSGSTVSSAELERTMSSFLHTMDNASCLFEALHNSKKLLQDERMLAFTNDLYTCNVNDVIQFMKDEVREHDLRSRASM